MDEADRAAPVSDAAFWEAAYREGRDGWDLGHASPPLVRAAGWVAPRGAAVVLGSGRGHDARMLAEAGWKPVVGVDFAESATAEAQRLTPPTLADRIEWRNESIFDLGGSDRGVYALALEHTSYCAIDPARRAEWMWSVHSSLARRGQLLALFYTHARPGGPPFGARVEDVRKTLIDAGFVVEREEIPEDSIERRRGEEWLVLARRVS
jgi:hypothetical protein